MQARLARYGGLLALLAVQAMVAVDGVVWGNGLQGVIWGTHPFGVIWGN